MQKIEKDLIAFRDAVGEAFDVVPPESFLQAHKEAGTTYVEQCTEIICKRFSISPDLRSFVYHCVYLSNQHVRKLEKQAHDEELSRQGFCFMVWDWLRAFPQAERADILIQGENILGGSVEKIIKNCRIVGSGEDIKGFLPPRCKRRGFAPHNVYGVRLAA